jgi:hypothetical protein
VKRNRPLFSLIGFCIVTVLAAALELAALFAAGTVAFAVASTPALSADDPVSPPTRMAVTAGGKTYVGLVTDDHCGARHEMESGESPSECTRMCVRNGAKYTLVDGESKYTLDGNTSDLEKLAGQRAKIVGTLAGTTIKVSSTGQ